MSAGTNTAGTLPHDQNAGRFVAPTIPQYVKGTDPEQYLTQLGSAIADLVARLQTSHTEIQRAFRTQGQGSVEVTVVQDMNHDGTNWAKVFLPMRVQAKGATNTTTITGEAC